MKNYIRSLLGIEMSIGNLEIKPILLCLGILLFITLSFPLLVVYSYIYIKFTLLDAWNDIKKERQKYIKGKFKWF